MTTTLSAKIKKELRDYAKISNIKQLYSKYGVNNADDAYKALNKEFINEQKRIAKEQAIIKAKEEADRILKEIKRKQEEKNAIKQLGENLKKMKKENKKEITIKLDKFKSIKDAINLLIKKFDKLNPNVKYNLVVNGKHYPMTNTNKFNILELLKKSLIEVQETEGSDAEFVAQIFNVDKITLEIFDPTNKYKKDNGAFFKYNHKTEIDLSRFQIYKSNIKNYDDCLIYSLNMGGLNEEKCEKLKLMCKSKNIPVCKLEEICNHLEIKINLKKICGDRARVEIYGKKYNEVYNVGLLDEHYFINELTDITSYALTNYFDLLDITDFNYIHKKEGKYYKKDKSRCIESFELIKILLENKDKYLTTINKLDITYTQHYNKVNDEIINLNYEPKLDVTYKPVKASNIEKDDIKFVNIFADFETSTINNLHTPYLCRFIDENNKTKCFIGEDCGLQMFKYLSFTNKNIRLIFHNLSYDIRFLYKYVTNITEITKGSKVLSCKCKFNNLNIQMKDSLLLIPMALKKFPKTFNIKNVVKEVISYDMYNKTDCLEKRFITIEEGLKWINENDKQQFLDNIARWNLNNDGLYDCIEYSNKYCEIDCYILKEGYNKFKEWMQLLANIDIDKVLTIASLAHRYFINEGCYEEVNEISSIPQVFIQKCVVGGRVMCSENKKCIITNKRLMDFDAVSLYPSAMSRMDGFLKGLPKVITNTNYSDLKLKDGYFVEIIIKSVGIKRKFPLMSYINDNGIRTFTNEMIGKTMYIDKAALEDLIKFQDIEFDIIRGYYFDEGLNTTINDVIKKVFYERVKLKKNKNPAEVVYKLIMNSGYGKSIMKEVETETKYFNNEDEMKVFVSRNYNWVIEFNQLADSKLWKCKLVNTLNTHFNIAHVGVSILSWSKRIMNEVMCLAEDNNLNIYYQDTDSMHIEENDIDILATKFKQLYGRELIGEDMGQFHSDFELEGCSNIYASRSIFLGKKCYIDELKGIDENGNEQIGYHIRMKGVSSGSIKYTWKKGNYENAFDLYVDLYKGKKIEFDLTEGGNKGNFKYETNGTVTTLEEFKRVLAF